MGGAVAAVAASMAGAGVSAWVGGTAGALLGAVVSSGLGFVATSLVGTKPKTPDLSAFDSDFASGLLGNKSASDACLPVIYGSRRTGGTRVLMRPTGTKNKYLHIVLALCHGPVQAIHTVYLNGVASTDEKFDGLVTVTKHLGSDDQEADAALVAEVDEWTAAHRLRGVAYVYLRIKYDSQVFSSIPEITADVDGMRVYDPRDGELKFSKNPALVCRDYLTSTRYGRGVAPAGVDDDLVMDAANYCDEDVPKGGETALRYTCNGAVDTEQPMMENLSKLLTSMRGVCVFSGGLYKFRVDRPGVPIFVLDEDNIELSSISVQLGSKRNTYNLVEAQFYNPGEDWQPDFAAWSDETARSADNGMILRHEIDLPYVTDAATAQQIATLNGKASRRQVRVELHALPEGLECEVFDVVGVTLPNFGWASKPFRVLGMELAENGSVTMRLLEYDDGAYDFGTIPFIPARARTTLPSTGQPGPPANLVLESGTAVLFLRGDGTVASRIRALWTSPADAYVLSGGQIEMQYRRSDAETWKFGALLSGSADQTDINDVQDNVAYDVRVRAVNSRGMHSPWATVYGHVVQGKNQPPADVGWLAVQQNRDVVTFSWPQVPDLDAAGYEIRYAPEGDFDWNGAAVVTAVTKGTRITTAAIPPGVWTFGIKARDTSQNYSAGVAAAGAEIVNFNDVVLEADESPRWAGTLTGCLVHPVSRRLIPLSTQPVSEEGWATFDEFVPSPVAEMTYESSELDLGFNSKPRIYAAVSGGLGYGARGLADPRFELRTRREGEGYEAWNEWTVAYAACRYLTGRVKIETASGVGVLTSYRLVADVAERSEGSGGSVVVPGGGLAVTFDERFHLTPNISVSARAAGLIAVYDNETPTGFTMHLLDPGTLASVGGAGTWQAVGA